jgi:SET family sugar efflux transporter-like MFS transporter
VENPAPFRLKSLIPLAVLSVSVGTAGALVFPFISLFLITEIGAGPFALGAFLLTVQIATVVVSTVLAKLSDARDIRRTLMLIAAAAGACSYALHAVVRDYWLLLIVSCTLVPLTASLFPQLFAYARHSLQRSGAPKVSQLIGNLRMLISVAWVGGPPVGALLIGFGGFTTLFAVATGLYLWVGFLLLRTPRVEPASSAEPLPDQVQDRPRGTIVFAAVAVAFVTGAGSLAVAALPLFVTQDLHGTTADAGLILGLCAALEIPLMIWFSFLTVKVDLHRLMLVGLAVALAYYAVMLVTASPWQVAAAQVLNALVIASVMGVGISYFQTLAPDRPGYATTLYTNMTTTGSMLAGPLLGVAAKFGYRNAYLMALVMCVIGLGLMVLARPKRVS